MCARCAIGAAVHAISVATGRPPVRQVFDPADPGTRSYDLLTSIVVPRPIAWISTTSADGVDNLAPHSFFTVACHAPPMVSFTSVGHKDTLRNVMATGEFVVNVASEGRQEQVNASSAPYDATINEAAILGIALEPSETVSPLRVADAPASIECRLHTTLPVGDSTIVIGTVVAITVVESALVDGRPTMAALRPLSRLGRDEWGLPPEVIRLTRPRRT